MQVSSEITFAVLVTWAVAILSLVWRISALVSNLQRISDDLHELTSQVTKHMDETRGAIQNLKERTLVLESERKWGPH